MKVCCDHDIESAKWTINYLNSRNGFYNLSVQSRRRYMRTADLSLVSYLTEVSRSLKTQGFLVAVGKDGLSYENDLIAINPSRQFILVATIGQGKIQNIEMMFPRSTLTVQSDYSGYYLHIISPYGDIIEPLILGKGPQFALSIIHRAVEEAQTNNFEVEEDVHTETSRCHYV